ASVFQGRLVGFRTAVEKLHGLELAASFPRSVHLPRSVRYHFGSGTRTGCSDRILKLGLRGEIELSPQDGETLNIRDGDTVRVVSSSGAIKRQVRFNKWLRQGTISIPLAFNGNDAMNLLAMTQPDMPDSPGWKTCRVKLEKI
ncbi:MAG: hypothetical protein JSV38_02310, partial [Desulfobacterales bacterium]